MESKDNKLPYNDAKISNDAKVKSAKWYPTSPAMSDADRKVAVRDQVRFEDGYMVGYKAALASETHIEIDDCSMLGKPSSKLGFYTVTMFPDDGKPVNLRLSKDAAEALASVLTIGGEIDDSTELPPVQAQPQDRLWMLRDMELTQEEADELDRIRGKVQAQPQDDRIAQYGFETTDDGGEADFIEKAIERWKQPFTTDDEVLAFADGIKIARATTIQASGPKCRTCEHQANEGAYYEGKSYASFDEIKKATDLGSDPAKNDWQRGWNAAMNHVRDFLGVPLK